MWKFKLWEEEGRGYFALVILKDNDVVGICDVRSAFEAGEKVAEMKKNRDAYKGWVSCLREDNVADCTMDKYDDNGDPVDVSKHPWTLEELYEAIRYSHVFIDDEEIDDEVQLDGQKVRIVFEDTGYADILGEIVLAEDGRIHIATN